jgi:acyl-coenzyme A thioesterase PaaI-like protein
MAVSDLAMYFIVLSMLGPVVLAVTTSLNINFLRKPSAGELLVVGKLLKLGKRLAVGEVSVFAEGSDEPVSHATVTYSIPRES